MHITTLTRGFAPGPRDPAAAPISDGRARPSGVPSSRVPLEAMERFACDTSFAAQVPAGVRLEFTGNAGAVEVSFATGTAHPLATPAEDGCFSVWVDGTHYGAVSVEAASTGTARIPLPVRDPSARVQVYVPERYTPQLLGIEPVDGKIGPAPAQRRWVAYGDSITQGWSTSDPGRAWPAAAGRLADLEVCNLGFAGAARGELPAASFVASTQADVISLAWGTNCWSQIPMDGPYIAELMRLFLHTVRGGQPKIPIVVLSPIIRPGAESTPNAAGATLAELRTALEQAVMNYAECPGGSRLHLVPGKDLVLEDQLVDGIHPGDEGHAVIAQAMARAVTAALERS